MFVVTNHGHDFAAETHRSFVQWEGTGGAIRMDMGVNLDYPKGVPDTLSYAERGSLRRTVEELPVKGNWFPDAFVGSMGALQSYVEGSDRGVADRVRVGVRNYGSGRSGVSLKRTPD